MAPDHPYGQDQEVIRCLAVLATVLVVALGDVSPAAANHDGARQEGQCARGTRWRMEAENHDGRIELRVRFDTRHARQRWSWVLLHNGTLSDRGTARTSDTSRSFEIERTAVDVDGQDGFRLRATHKELVCAARVTL